MGTFRSETLSHATHSICVNDCADSGHDGQGPSGRMTPRPCPEPMAVDMDRLSGGGVAADHHHLEVVLKAVDSRSKSERDGDDQSGQSEHSEIDLDGESEALSESQRALLRRLKFVAFLLFQKYIRTYSELEVNISSALRVRYYALMEDRERWMNETEVTVHGLYSLFDDVIVEMYRLMGRSLLRFLKSDDVVVLKEKLLRESEAT